MARLSKDSVKSFPYGKIRNVEDVGAAIRAKRVAIGMQQEQLAALAGVGRSWNLQEADWARLPRRRHHRQAIGWGQAPAAWRG